MFSQRTFSISFQRGYYKIFITLKKCNHSPTSYDLSDSYDAILFSAVFSKFYVRVGAYLRKWEYLL